MLQLNFKTYKKDVSVSYKFYVVVNVISMIHLQSVLTDVGWRVSDGVIQCKFSRSIYTPQDPVRFSLNNSYYLLVAHGTAEYGELFNCINGIQCYC